MYTSIYLHFSKYMNSDHLCYIFLASFTSPELIKGKSILSSIRITIQACVKDLYETLSTWLLSFEQWLRSTDLVHRDNTTISHFYFEQWLRNTSLVHRDNTTISHAQVEIRQNFHEEIRNIFELVHSVDRERRIVKNKSAEKEGWSGGGTLNDKYRGYNFWGKYNRGYIASLLIASLPIVAITTC